MIPEKIKQAEIAAFKREIVENYTLLGVQETAALLSRTPAHVYQLVEDGRLTPYREGRSANAHLRFKAAEVRAYIDSLAERIR
jgi:excisionase family DNA binding protein